MLPILLLIAKAATMLGVEVQWDKEELESFLQTIDTAILQAEVEAVTRMLITVQVILILIQSAIQKFDGINKITVSVFAQPEIDNIRASAEKITEAAGQLGKLLPNRIAGDTAAKLSDHLAEVKQLPQGFRLADCLAACREAATLDDMNKRCLLMALTLIQGFVDETQLKQSQEWANDAQITGDVPSWLKDKWRTDGLGARINTCFGNAAHLNEQQELNQIVKMLDGNNRELVLMIEERLDDILKENIEKFPPALAAKKDSWSNLVRAIHGIVAWQIYHQAEVAVREAQAVLDRINL